MVFPFTSQSESKIVTKMYGVKYDVNGYDKPLAALFTDVEYDHLTFVYSGIEVFTTHIAWILMFSDIVLTVEVIPYFRVYIVKKQCCLFVDCNPWRNGETTVFPIIVEEIKVKTEMGGIWIGEIVQILYQRFRTIDFCTNLLVERQ